MGYQALLFCPDEKTARAVTQVLTELDFTVDPCSEPFAAVKKLMAQHFDAVVVDCDNEQNATLLFKSARNSASNQSSLAVAVVEGQAGVAKAFRIGANLVLTKPINVEQAKGTLRVARGLLRKGGDPSKPAPATPATSSTAPSAVIPKSQGTTFQSARPAAAPPAKPSFAAPAVKTPAPKPPAPAATASLATPAARATSLPNEEISAPKAPVAEAKPSASAHSSGAPKKNFPWQPAKPGAEPMASALRKAAEAAGMTENAEPPSTEVASPVAERPLITPSGSASGAASAPAPAKVKPAADVPSVTPMLTPAPSVVPEPEPEPVTAHEEQHIAEPEPPSFSMGAPAYEEEEPASNKKALIIVAAVVLLAALAGYLGWKNMGGKSASPAPTGSVSAPVPPATSSAAPAGETLDMSPPADSGRAASRSPESSASAAMSKPSPARSTPSESSPVRNSETEQEAPEPAPAAPAFVVKNEQPRPEAKSAPDTEQPLAPSVIGVPTGTDSKALAAIGSTPVSVPKPSNQLLKISQGVSEGLVIKRVPPRYPSQALQLHKEGSVQLQATVTKQGDISNIKVLSGDPMLARAAEDAVRQWKYKPYYLNGEPVDIQTQITVNFKLPR